MFFTAPAIRLADFRANKRRWFIPFQSKSHPESLIANAACNAYTVCMQYTIRNVPEYLDSLLRETARAQGKSLNEVAIEALSRGAGLGESRCRQRDLRDIAGTWQEDPAFDSAIAAQDTVDEEMWK